MHEKVDTFKTSTLQLNENFQRKWDWNKGIIIYQTWVSLASDPLLTKKAFAIFLAVNISRSSLASSCIWKYYMYKVHIKCKLTITISSINCVITSKVVHHLFPWIGRQVKIPQFHPKPPPPRWTNIKNRPKGTFSTLSDSKYYYYLWNFKKCNKGFYPESLFHPLNPAIRELNEYQRRYGGSIPKGMVKWQLL